MSPTSCKVLHSWNFGDTRTFLGDPVSGVHERTRDKEWASKASVHRNVCFARRVLAEVDVMVPEFPPEFLLGFAVTYTFVLSSEL